MGEESAPEGAAGQFNDIRGQRPSRDHARLRVTAPTIACFRVTPGRWGLHLAASSSHHRPTVWFAEWFVKSSHCGNAAGLM